MTLPAGQHFGGAWTEQKLTTLQAYLRAYRVIFTGNERARHFETWYVDAFAGTGLRLTSDAAPLLDLQVSGSEVKQYQDGSAAKALGLERPFDNYLFIEKSRSRIEGLQTMISERYPHLKDQTKYRQGDANAELQRWCSERNWRRERAVVFLDPFGMQVEWTTIQTLAATKGVDLWYLFPAIARLLRHDANMDESWKQRLTALFGSDSWEAEFYKPKVQATLFGDQEDIERSATETAIEKYIVQRLATCFGKNVARTKILRNSRGSPLYFLCFAASNDRGAATALRIANDIMG